MQLDYFHDIMTVVTISIIMVVSPGQDFAIITKNSLLYSRKIGIISAIGIFSAIWLHVIYSLAGIAIIISSSPYLYNFIKYTGALYLLFLGLKGLFKKHIDTVPNITNTITISNTTAFKNGFISNALNPKTTLFFLSIFTQVVNVNTPFNIQLLFGFIIAISHLIWFILVAYFFSSNFFINKFNSKRLFIERFMGLILILFAIRIII